MGVLDDAIREHIELKRRHGVSETDLERQEQEALGPARREAPAAAEPAGEEPLAEPAAVEPGGPDAESAAEGFDVALTEVIPPAAEPPDPASDPLAEPDPGAESDPGAEPLPPESAREPELDDPEEEDVLEETPEFLQETPEHDRLWFEQKPPRDFDFDE
jgi:hypothetical protein